VSEQNSNRFLIEIATKQLHKLTAILSFAATYRIDSASLLTPAAIARTISELNSNRILVQEILVLQDLVMLAGTLDHGDVSYYIRSFNKSASLGRHREDKRSNEHIKSEMEDEYTGAGFSETFFEDNPLIAGLYMALVLLAFFPEAKK
jgi:hypothetical protein